MTTSDVNNSTLPLRTNTTSPADMAQVWHSLSMSPPKRYIWHVSADGGSAGRLSGRIIDIFSIPWPSLWMLRADPLGQECGRDWWGNYAKVCLNRQTKLPVKIIAHKLLMTSAAVEKATDALSISLWLSWRQSMHTKITKWWWFVSQTVITKVFYGGEVRRPEPPDDDVASESGPRVQIAAMWRQTLRRLLWDCRPTAMEVDKKCFVVPHTRKMAYKHKVTDGQVKVSIVVSFNTSDPTFAIQAVILSRLNCTHNKLISNCFSKKYFKMFIAIPSWGWPSN